MIGNPEGIIPARAGFTCVGGIPGFAMWDHPRTRGVYSPGASRPTRNEDHPRTRGVYPEVGVRSIWNRGSSPHARGLPQVAETRFGGFRIIPARAGFTLGTFGGV